MLRKSLLFLLLLMVTGKLFAQEQPLPHITVKNINNKIIVSWINGYTKPVTTLNIQRSYDSLKNYSTIGSVLSPQSRENGYTDANPPYTKMYYRVFVAFEGGAYVITDPVRPVKEMIPEDTVENYSWTAVTRPPATEMTVKTKSGRDSIVKIFPAPRDSIFINPPAKPGVTYPSLRIFTAKDNNVILHLPEAETKKYTVKFFDENEKFLFELTKLKEEYLIMEKVNFVRPGWFSFEIYENGVLLEKNKFQILKDPKKL